MAVADVRAEQDRVDAVKELLEKKVRSMEEPCGKRRQCYSWQCGPWPALFPLFEWRNAALAWTPCTQRTKKRAWKSASHEYQQEVEALHERLLGKQEAINRLKQQVDTIAVEMSLLAVARTQQVEAELVSRPASLAGNFSTTGQHGVSVSSSRNPREGSLAGGDSSRPQSAANVGGAGASGEPGDSVSALQGGSFKASIDQARAALDAVAGEVTRAASMLLVTEGELDAAERLKQQLLVSRAGTPSL